MNKIYCLNKIAEVGTKHFKNNYELTDSIDGASGILVRSGDMHDMEFPETLLGIARAGAGVNNIPLEDCGKKGIVVFNTPGANANGVKELVLGSLFLAARDVTDGISWVLENKADEDIANSVEKNKSRFAGTEIAGKRLGVIGLGAIGARVANAALHLGMEVYGYDPMISVDAAWMLSRSIKHIENLEEIYKECDYITLHVPLLQSTKGMINESAIDMMKAGTVILNFSRGGLVDDEAIVKALEEDRIKRYVTDFPSPLVAGKKGVIAIPHLGASTEESEDNCAVMAVKELRNYIENGNIKNSVNYPDCDMGICTGVSRISVHHENIPNMIGQVTGAMAAAGINITDMTNKSRGQCAYTLLDLESPVSDEVLDKLRAISGIIRVRKIK